MNTNGPPSSPFDRFVDAMIRKSNPFRQIPVPKIQPHEVGVSQDQNTQNSVLHGDVGKWERAWAETIRHRIVFWTFAVLVVSVLLKVVVVFVILAEPRLANPSTIVDIVSAVINDGVLILVLKQVVGYYFQRRK